MFSLDRSRVDTLRLTSGVIVYFLCLLTCCPKRLLTPELYKYRALPDFLPMRRGNKQKYCSCLSWRKSHMLFALRASGQHSFLNFQQLWFSNMPNFLLERYLSGECHEVWRDLMLIGPAVRDEPYYKDAVAVAGETMKRARHNIELIIPKLERLGYRFTQEADAEEQANFYLRPESDAEKAIRKKYLHSDFVTQNKHEQAMVAKLKRIEATKQLLNKHAGFIAKVQAALAERGQNEAPGKPASQGSPMNDPDIFRPAGRNAKKDLDRSERKLGGPLPISLRSWYEQVGAVSLMGYHEALNPKAGFESPDPLVIDPLKAAAEAWFGRDLEFEGDEIELPLAPDEVHKAFASGGDPYAMKLPDSAADGAFLNEWHHTTFVSYLRIVFQWGGFPGWERAAQRPQKELDYLRENLLAL